MLCVTFALRQQIVHLHFKTCISSVPADEHGLLNRSNIRFNCDNKYVWLLLSVGHEIRNKQKKLTSKKRNQNINLNLLVGQRHWAFRVCTHLSTKIAGESGRSVSRSCMAFHSLMQLCSELIQLS